MGRNRIEENRCGTHAGWQAHTTAKETPCQPCKDARNVWKRQWREQNVEVERLRIRIWRSKNPHKSREYNRKRRAVEHIPYTEAQVLFLYGPFCHLCSERIDLHAPRNCKGENWERGLHIDHLIPLVKGGIDSLENARPAHALCNLRKFTKVDEESATAPE